MSVAIDLETCLVLVDLQNDFSAGGVLPVKEAETAIEILNQYIPYFQGIGAPIFAVRDWHPKNHVSFKERGGPWPPHCLQGTKGADLNPNLKLPYGATVIAKGFLVEQDSDSAFQGTDLEIRLRQKMIKRVLLGGLGIGDCLKKTAVYSLKAGFETFILTDGIRCLEVKRGDSQKSVQEIVKTGAQKLTLKNLAPLVKIRRQFMAKSRGKA